MKAPSKASKIQKKSTRLIRSGFRHLRNEGLLSTIKKTYAVFLRQQRYSYKAWMKRPLYTKKQLQMQKSEEFPRDIKFSIVSPIFNTPEGYLREMIESVFAQTYQNWELCMADGSDDAHEYVRQICLEYSEKDNRIKYKKLEKNLGIAENSNACIEMAGGDYISFLDHDDLLHPAALHDVMKEICNCNADIVYTDEVTFAESKAHEVLFVHFKPDYAPDNLLANNYICHFTSVRSSLLKKCGMFRGGYDGAQDHELMLRLTKEAKSIVHIPEVLYYWRAHSQSTAEAEGNKPYVSSAGIRVVTDYLHSQGIEAHVELAKDIPTIYRVFYPLPSRLQKVSIIIPNYDHVNDLRDCVSSVLEKTSYPNYEIIIVENNSTEPETFEYYKEITASEEKVTVVTWPGTGFNWAAINNYAVEKAVTGEYLLLLNNDMEVISPNWIEEMMMYAQRQDVGIVGAKLYYPDGTIQHAGVILGLGGAAGHAFQYVGKENKGYMGRLCYAQNLSAVTGACMLLRRSVWEEVGGVDEQFAVSLNDIDLCMRIREAGYLVVWTPFAELYHYESKSRGSCDSMEKLDGLNRERKLFRDRWGEILENGDPYYNPNLTLMRSDFTPKNRRYERLYEKNK